MDYKKVIKSRTVRVKIMQALSFVPDKWMVSLQYRIKTGHKLNLKDPKRFTEKLQWYKLYYRDPIMKQCVDKYDVREYVKKCGLSGILNDCYGVFDDPDQIDFSSLPDSFVLKDTLGGGGNSVILVPDKNQFDIDKVKKQMHAWITENTKAKNPGREWVYEGSAHRIIVERYIHPKDGFGALVDYKFFCFNGKIFCLYVMSDRNLDLKVGIYDRNFTKMDAYISYDKRDTTILQKPEKYDEMCKIAEQLSARFPHARIDLYDQNGKIIFGEITFFSGSGYTLFSPDSFDYELGQAFLID